MKRAIFALVGTAVALVLLLSYKTTAPKNQLPPAAVGGGSDGAAGSDSSASTTTPSGGNATTTPSTSPGSGTSGTGSTGGGTQSALGDAVDTRWGPVQLKVVKTGGRIVDVQAVQYPNGTPRDLEINSQALPILRSEVLQAQNAQIDMVSGATVTSQGYLQSLQSALDKLNGA